MVTSVSGNTPYSYLEQLTGQAAYTAPAPAAATTSDTDNTDTSNAATSTASGAFGLPTEVINLLQSVGNDSTISSLLGVNSSSDSSSNSLLGGLTGATKTPSASDILASLVSNVMETQASSGLYQAALNAAASKKASAATNIDRISSIIAAYNAAINQTAQVTNSVNTTG